MKYLLDTCVLSELTKPAPSAKVVAWLRERDASELALSVLTIGELERGVERLPRGRKKRALRAWLDGLCTTYTDRIIDISVPIVVEWGRSSARAEAAGKRVPVIDALIASSAIVLGLTVVTRNTADLAAAGAPVFDPWG